MVGAFAPVYFSAANSNILVYESVPDCPVMLRPFKVYDKLFSPIVATSAKAVPFSIGLTLLFFDIPTDTLLQYTRTGLPVSADDVIVTTAAILVSLCSYCRYYSINKRVHIFPLLLLNIYIDCSNT